MKICFKCGCRKKLVDFYRHPQMADGLLNKCKECTKNDVRARYRAAIVDRHRYEHERWLDPRRRRAAAASRRLHIDRHPDRARARNAVSNAIRDGRLKKAPCERCHSWRKVQAHHHDYSRPLDVRWLCFKCHRESEHGQKVTT